MVSVMRVVFYRGVVAPIENVATTVNDADSAADRRSWLQWISGMQAPCARAPERRDGEKRRAVADGDHIIRKPVLANCDAPARPQICESPSQIQRVPAGLFATGDARCWKVLQ
jgi:hypothetical protein